MKYLQQLKRKIKLVEATSKGKIGKKGRKKGGNVKSGVSKTGVALLYHKMPAYNLPTQPQKDELRDYRISLKGNTDRKGGGEK